jgi:hypothetical protein
MRNHAFAVLSFSADHENDVFVALSLDTLSTGLVGTWTSYTTEQSEYNDHFFPLAFARTCTCTLVVAAVLALVKVAVVAVFAGVRFVQAPHSVPL